MSKFEMHDVVFQGNLCDTGYTVEFAVGTTYSLDLDTFMSLPFALKFHEEPDEKMREDHPCQYAHYVFSALRLCSDRLAVFCNYSDIKVPVREQKIHALMDSVIFPVPLGAKRNFHPKIWVVKETKIKKTKNDKTESRIKLIVMSRNLTKDGSLDCACVMSGKIDSNSSSSSKHEPLCKFLEELRKHVKNSSKKEKLDNLINDVKDVKAFDLEGSVFDDYEFLPMGIDGYSGSGTLNEISSGADEVAVVSPFLDNETIAKFSNVNKKMLLTREVSISEAAVKSFGQDNIWTMSPKMVDNERTAVDLHAKMYFSKPKGSNKHYLYLGSTNATRRGFERNVEFMIKLRFSSGKISYSKFCESFTKYDDHRFEAMVGVCENTSLDSKFQEYQQTLRLREAIDSIKMAVFRQEDAGSYAITLMRKGSQNTESITVYPFLREDLKTDLVQETSFHGLKLSDLSEFFIVELNDPNLSPSLSRVVKISTKGFPLKERDAAFFRDEIKSESDFMDLIAFILSDSKTSYYLDKNQFEKFNSSNSSTGKNDNLAAVYEILLRKAYERPVEFDEIMSSVNDLRHSLHKTSVIPPGFDELCDKVSEAMPKTR